MVPLLFVPVLMWSFVGLLVKEANAAFSPSVISVGRFAFGVVFLGLWFIVRGRRPAIDFRAPWLWFGAAAKTLNYVLENIPLVRGASWGYIVEQPIQAVALMVLAFAYFRERPDKRRIIAAAFCVVGVALTASRGFGSTAGNAVADFLLFAAAALGASVHFMSQKVLMARSDSGSMNLGVFLLGSAMSAVALPFSGPLVVGPIAFGPAAALVGLGFVTGASFLIWGAVASRVPFLVSSLLSSSLAVFALAWGILLRRISPPALAGAAIFVAGLVLMNVRKPRPHG